MVDYIYESGEPIDIGSHGQTDYVFASGEPVPNSGKSNVVFESGHGIGGLQEIIDNWEDGDRSEYTDDTTWGNGSGVVLQTSTAYEGDYLLEANTNGAVWAMGSTSGLAAYPSAGDTINYYVYFPNTKDNALYLYYGTQNESGANSSSYRVTIRNSVNSIQLMNRNNGNNMGDVGVDPIPSFEWLRLEVIWGTDGFHEVNLYDADDNNLGGPSGTDTQMSSGGIGVGMNNRNTNNSRAFVDLITRE